MLKVFLNPLNAIPNRPLEPERLAIPWAQWRIQKFTIVGAKLKI